MLDAGIIEPSTSELTSAPVLVRKRDGTEHWCIDYRNLNELSTNDVFSIMNEC